MRSPRVRHDLVTEQPHMKIGMRPHLCYKKELSNSMNWTSPKPAAAGLAEITLLFVKTFEKIQLIQVKPGIDD